MKKMQPILVSLKRVHITAQVSETVNFMSKFAVVFFHETIAYLKGNSKIKEKFFKKILPQK